MSALPIKKILLMLGILSILLIAGCAKSEAYNFNKAIESCQKMFGDDASVFQQYCVDGQPEYDYVCHVGINPKGFIDSKFNFIAENGIHPCDSGNVFK